MMKVLKFIAPVALSLLMIACSSEEANTDALEGAQTEASHGEEGCSDDCEKECCSKDKAACEKKCSGEDKAACEKKCSGEDKAACEKKCSAEAHECSMECAEGCTAEKTACEEGCEKACCAEEA